METTIREKEAALRAFGYSRRETEELAAALHINRKEESMSINNPQLEKRKAELAVLEKSFDVLKWETNRTPQGESLYWDLLKASRRSRKRSRGWKAGAWNRVAR